MLLTKEVNLQINGRNVKHLKEKGYLIPKILFFIKLIYKNF